MWDACQIIMIISINFQELFWVLTCSLNSSNSVWLVRRMSLCRRPFVVNWAIREANYLTRLSPCTEVIQRHVKLSVPTETKRSGDEKRSSERVTSPVRPIKAWKQPCVAVSDPAAWCVKKLDISLLFFMQCVFFKTFLSPEPQLIYLKSALTFLKTHF